jgi:predicted Zn-dependent peptidase
MEHSIYTNPVDNSTHILAPYDGTKAITLLLLVAAGSRYEDLSTNGLSHVIEHMFFKGGSKYKTTREVSEKIDGIGGEFNAFTSKEYVGYYIKVAKQHIEIACDVLSDMMLNATFPEVEMEKEKRVILEEINMYEDHPMHKAAMSFESLLFGDTTLGWNIAGTKEIVAGFDRNILVNFKESLYTGENMMIIASGGFETEETKQLLARYFSFKKGNGANGWKNFQSFPSSRYLHVHKPIEQTNIIIGAPTTGYNHDDKYALELLSVILGGNMSSRMFMNIREKEGLCYYVYTSTDLYNETGYIATYAGVDNSRVKKAEELILAELARAKNDISEEELHRAVSYIEGKMTLGFEDSEEIALFLGKQQLLEKEILTLDEVIEKYRKVSMTDIVRIANKYLNDFRTVTVGPKEIH